MKTADGCARPGRRSGASRGLTPGRWFTGFTLARERDPRFDFSVIEPCVDFPNNTFPGHLAAPERLSLKKEDDPCFWLRLWQHAAALPGLGSITANGIETTGDSAPHGAVHVTMERDPLEALKLGTYVGSCLAPGGLCAYSAGCVVLDVNKQVLYARDARRTVVGRQLVAISRGGELVCFSIYPRSASAALKALFRDHDLAFAAALGVPLHRETPGGKGYRIDLVIAGEWWDDGVDDAAMDSDSPARASTDHKASR